MPLLMRKPLNAPMSQYASPSASCTVEANQMTGTRRIQFPVGLVQLYVPLLSV
jgi:hypothetical protein